MPPYISNIITYRERSRHFAHDINSYGVITYVAMIGSTGYCNNCKSITHLMHYLHYVLQWLAHRSWMQIIVPPYGEKITPTAALVLPFISRYSLCDHECNLDTHACTYMHTDTYTHTCTDTHMGTYAQTCNIIACYGLFLCNLLYSMVYFRAFSASKWYTQGSSDAYKNNI